MEGPAWTMQRGFTTLDVVGEQEARWSVGREGSWGERWNKGETRVAWGSLEDELLWCSTKARRPHVTCFILSAKGT